MWHDTAFQSCHQTLVHILRPLCLPKIVRPLCLSHIVRPLHLPDMLRYLSLPHTALQHTATYCNTLQHTATHILRYLYLPHILAHLFFPSKLTMRWLRLVGSLKLWLNYGSLLQNLVSICHTFSDIFVCY